MRDLFVSWKEGRLKVDPYQKNMPVGYSPVPVNSNGTTPHANQIHKCTLKKILCFFVIVILSCVFILAACLGPTFLRHPKFCPEKHSFTTQPQSFTGRNTLVHYRHTQRHLPDCIIIGARKAGTRALITYLNMHPNIVAAKKEIHFFDDQHNYSKGISWYRKQMPFAFSEQITIEKTPNYFVNDDVPGRIFSLNASIKLILIVRDPLYRAISDYAQIRERRESQGLVMEDFEDLVFSDEDDESVETVNTQYKAINRSLYFYHMKKWLKYFSLDQIHIVDGDNMVVRPLEEVKKVEQFLGVEPRIKKNNFYYDREKGFYCVNPDLKKPKCLNKTKGRMHPKIRKKVREILNEFFEPWNKQFFDLVGRTFIWPQKRHYISKRMPKVKH